jgi:hypothetical protein
MVSKKWTLNSEETQKVIKNSVVFASPVALIYLGFVLSAVQKDGFQLNDLVPSSEAVTVIVLWVINTLIDGFKKFSQGK